MSVILDVLRKLDREKSSRRSAAANITLDILRSDPPRSEKRTPLYFAAIGLTAIAAAAVTYALVELGILTISPSSKPMHPPTTSQEIATAPHDPDSLSKVSLPPAMTPAASSQKITPAPLPREANPDVPSGVSRAPREIPTPDEIRTTADPSGKKMANKGISQTKPTVAPQNTEGLSENTTIPPQQTPDKSITVPPSLKISAIIWYEDPSKRFAMINDKIAHEGSLIEAVKVEEIHPDRVRFIFNGKHFEISVK